MSREVFLTTTDNPFNPKTEFDDWYKFDTQKGYNTCSYLARIAKTSEGFSDEDNSLEIEKAIDDIVFMNLLGLYKKVVINSDG